MINAHILSESLGKINQAQDLSPGCEYTGSIGSRRFQIGNDNDDIKSATLSKIQKGTVYKRLGQKCSRKVVVISRPIPVTDIVKKKQRASDTSD